jgi:hypothetical protein
MRATILAAVLSFGALSLVTLDRASSLPGLSARPSAASCRPRRGGADAALPNARGTAIGVPITCPIPARAHTNIVLAALRADLLPAQARANTAKFPPDLGELGNAGAPLATISSAASASICCLSAGEPARMLWASCRRIRKADRAIETVRRRRNIRGAAPPAFTGRKPRGS